jgi:hypothetical protein
MSAACRSVHSGGRFGMELPLALTLPWTQGVPRRGPVRAVPPGHPPAGPAPKGRARRAPRREGPPSYPPYGEPEREPDGGRGPGTMEPPPHGGDSPRTLVGEWCEPWPRVYSQGELNPTPPERKSGVLPLNYGNPAGLTPANAGPSGQPTNGGTRTPSVLILSQPCIPFHHVSACRS